MHEALTASPQTPPVSGRRAPDLGSNVRCSYKHLACGALRAHADFARLFALCVADPDSLAYVPGAHTGGNSEEAS
jgi:hypothetical protein